MYSSYIHRSTLTTENQMVFKTFSEGLEIKNDPCREVTFLGYFFMNRRCRECRATQFDKMFVYEYYIYSSHQLLETQECRAYQKFSIGSLFLSPGTELRNLLQSPALCLPAGRFRVCTSVWGWSQVTSGGWLVQKEKALIQHVPPGQRAAWVVCRVHLIKSNQDFKHAYDTKYRYKTPSGVVSAWIRSTRWNQSSELPRTFLHTSLALGFSRVLFCFIKLFSLLKVLAQFCELYQMILKHDECLQGFLKLQLSWQGESSLHPPCALNVRANLWKSPLPWGLQQLWELAQVAMEH